MIIVTIAILKPEKTGAAWKLSINSFAEFNVMRLFLINKMDSEKIGVVLNKNWQ